MIDAYRQTLEIVGNCERCGQAIDKRKVSVDGGAHLNVFECVEALKRRIRELEWENRELKEKRPG